MSEDLISRRAAMAYPLSWEHYDKEHGDSKFICGVESYREYIEHLPSAEPKTGQWITDKYGIILCSKCGWCAPQIMTGCLAGRHLGYVKSNFCWHCGADMRGDNNV